MRVCQLLIVLIIIVGCKTLKNSSANRIDFSSFDNLTCIPGISNQEKANGFLTVYKEYSNRKDFNEQLIQFLDNDSCRINYKYVGMFVKPNNGYTEISDFKLAESVLLNGLIRVNSESNEDTKYEKCSLLWDISILYFENDDFENAEKYAILAYKEPSMNCGELFPALDEEERTKYLEFFDKITE